MAILLLFSYNLSEKVINMKKLFTFLVYAITFATPALIVQYYSRFVDPMTSEEVRMATLAGTVVTVILAAVTGFSHKRPSVKSLARKYGNIKPAGNNEMIVKDPGSGAETLFRWNDKENLWESEHGTYLDQDHMKEWLQQRSSDRQWANKQRQKLSDRDTAFDRDIKAMGRKKK